MNTDPDGQPRLKLDSKLSSDGSNLDEDGEGSNSSLPVVTTSENLAESRVDIERQDTNEVNSDDDYDYSDDDNGDESESDDDDDDDENDEDDYDNDDEDDDDDDDDDDTKTKTPRANYEDKIRINVKKSKQQVTLTDTFQASKKSGNFEDSVEHGRQRKEDDSEDFAASGVRNGSEWSNLATSGIAGTERSALERDLARILQNDSPEAEDQESSNVTERTGKENAESEEAKFYPTRKFQQIKELKRKANIPQKVRYSHLTYIKLWACGGVVELNTMLQAGRSQVWDPAS
jgi:hypothetical protein